MISAAVAALFTRYCTHLPFCEVKSLRPNTKWPSLRRKTEVNSSRRHYFDRVCAAGKKVEEDVMIVALEQC